MWHRNQEKANKLKDLRKSYQQWIELPRCPSDCEHNYHKKVFGEYENIEPYVYGYKVHLDLIDATKNKEKGLREAIFCCSDSITFSESSKRRCEIRSFIVGYYLSQDSSIDNYFEKNVYKGGLLKLHSIDERSYEKLSDDAKKYFERKESDLVTFIGSHYYKRHVISYKPTISMSLLKEVTTQIIHNVRFVPDGDAISEYAFLNGLFEHDMLQETIYHTYYSRRDPWKHCRKGEGKKKRKEYEAVLQELAEE